MGINYATTLMKAGLVFQLKNSRRKMGLSDGFPAAYTTPTVRGIFICRFLFGLSTFLSLHSSL